MGVVSIKAWLTTPTHPELCIWCAILEAHHVTDVIALQSHTKCQIFYLSCPLYDALPDEEKINFKRKEMTLLVSLTLLLALDLHCINDPLNTLYSTACSGGMG